MDRGQNYSTVILLSLVLVFQSLTLGTATAQSDSGVTIPDWVKFNSAWWAEGKIPDADFIAAIEYLIKSEIITSPRIQVNELSEHDILLEQAETVPTEIPDWIKSNAEWYSQGLIGTTDFVKGLEYLVVEKIIQTPEIVVVDEAAEEKVEQINQGDIRTQVIQQSALDLGIDPEIYKEAYATMVWSQLATAFELEIKTYDAKKLEEQVEELWDQYDETEDDAVMQDAITAQQDWEIAKNLIKTVQQSLEIAESDAQKAKSDAQNAGVPVLDVEKAAEIPLEKLLDIKAIKNDSDYQDAVDAERDAFEKASAGVNIMSAAGMLEMSDLQSRLVVISPTEKTTVSIGDEVPVTFSVLYEDLGELRKIIEVELWYITEGAISAPKFDRFTIEPGTQTEITVNYKCEAEGVESFNPSISISSTTEGYDTLSDYFAIEYSIQKGGILCQP